MDSKELLNWVARPHPSEDTHLIEVYVSKSLDSGMQFPLGKLSPNKMDAVKKLLAKHFATFTSNQLNADYVGLGDCKIETYWWKRQDNSWNLGVRYVVEGKKFEHKDVAKIVNVDFTVSLAELEEKLFKGGMT